MQATISGSLRPVSAIVLGFSLAAHSPGSAREDLRVEIQPIGSLPRPGGPLPLQVTFERSAPGVLNGQLELEVPPPANVVLKSGELHLGPGIQRHELTLPPRRWNVQLDDIYVRARFATDDDTLDLGEHLLFPSFPFERVLKILAASDGAPGPRDSEIVRALQLEVYFRGAKGTPCPIATSVTVRGAEALPTHPLDLCDHDVVYLAGRNFDALSAPQLDAILRWVRAGGSLCLQLRSRPPPPQMEFLRELAGEGFVAELVGDLSPASRDAALLNRHRRTRSGLGCVLALAAGVPGKGEVTREGWLDSVGFLWKLRRSLRAALEAGGSWTAGGASGWSLDRDRRPPGSVCPSALIRAESVEAELLPDDIEVIPPPLVILLLVFFVLAIGPLEYIVLGYLRRRKLTWYVFPLTCAVFAGLTVKASDLFLSSSREVHSMTIVDLGEGGRVLRWNRIDLHYPESEGTVVREASGSLTSVLGNPEDSLKRYSFRSRAVRNDGLECEGRIPRSYRYRYAVRKWSPALLRTLSLEPLELDLPLDWDELGDLLFDGTSSYVSPKRVRSQLSALRGAGSEGELAVHLYSGRRRDACLQHVGTESSSLLLDVLVHANRGPHATFASLSPAAGPDLEDVPVLDPADPEQVLVVAVLKRGSGLLVLRRLFFRGEGR